MAVGFNGSTAFVENTTASIYLTGNLLTICAWVRANGSGGASQGRVLSVGFDQARPALQHDTSANTMRLHNGHSVVNGTWTFPATDGIWRAVAVSYDRSSVANDPVARVNFSSVTVTEISTPVGTRDVQSTAGWTIGNNSSRSQGWDGDLAYVQLWDSILSSADMDAALRSPGSVGGAVVSIRLLSNTDLNDQSGNGRDATNSTAITSTAGPSASDGLAWDMPTGALLLAGQGASMNYTLQMPDEL